MNGVIKQGVIGIVLTYCIASVYVSVKVILNEIYGEEIKRNNEFSFLKQKNEDLEAKVQMLEVHRRLFPSCMDILRYDPGVRGEDGIYPVYTGLEVKAVYCDMSTDGGGWTVIQRRQDGSTDFYRTWDEYRQGFGDPSKEYWIGNDAIHAMTKVAHQELRVDLEGFDGKKVHAQYSSFKVGNESSKYKLRVSGYSGTAGNSLEDHDGMKFSTFDKDNDNWIGGNYAELEHGAWWYNDYSGESNLNGEYTGCDLFGARFIHWYGWKELTALKGIVMLIRTKS